LKTGEGSSSIEVERKLRRGLALEYLSVGWMTVEGAVAVYSGIVAGSIALVAFGGDSFVELVSALAVAVYLRNRQSGNLDPSILHRTERVTAVLLFALIPVTGLSALFSYLTGTRAEGSLLGVIIAVAAVVMMPYLSMEKKSIGQETGCLPLTTDAVESATCFFMSIALLGGLLSVTLFGLWWVDYLATAIILAFIAREAIEAIGESR